jgi:hypothetical protein
MYIFSHLPIKTSECKFANQRSSYSWSQHTVYHIASVQSYQLQHLPINFVIHLATKIQTNVTNSCCCQIGFLRADVASKIHTDIATLSLRACCRLAALGRARWPARCTLSAPSHRGELAASSWRPPKGSSPRLAMKGSSPLPPKEGSSPSLSCSLPWRGSRRALERPPMEGITPRPRAASHGGEHATPSHEGQFAASSVRPPDGARCTLPWRRAHLLLPNRPLSCSSRR